MRLMDRLAGHGELAGTPSSRRRALRAFRAKRLGPPKWAAVADELRDIRKLSYSNWVMFTIKPMDWYEGDMDHAYDDPADIYIIWWDAMGSRVGQRWEGVIPGEFRTEAEARSFLNVVIDAALELGLEVDESNLEARG